jgi:hypothetical protein
MGSNFYELVGRAVVGFVRRRYGQELRVAALLGVGVAGAVAVAAYAATRDDQDA